MTGSISPVSSATTVQKEHPVINGLVLEKTISFLDRNDLQSSSLVSKSFRSASKPLLKNSYLIKEALGSTEASKIFALKLKQSLSQASSNGEFETELSTKIAHEFKKAQLDISLSIKNVGSEETTTSGQTLTISKETKIEHTQIALIASLAIFGEIFINLEELQGLAFLDPPAEPERTQLRRSMFYDDLMEGMTEEHLRNIEKHYLIEGLQDLGNVLRRHRERDISPIVTFVAGISAMIGLTTSLVVGRSFGISKGLAAGIVVGSLARSSMRKHIDSMLLQVEGLVDLMKPALTEFSMYRNISEYKSDTLKFVSTSSDDIQWNNEGVKMRSHVTFEGSDIVSTLRTAVQ